MVVYLHHRFFRFFPVLLVLICLQGIASDDSEWIDPDTADEHRTITRNDGTGPAYDLVFSDEFNSAGREFGAGEDPRWTALDKPDSVNSPLAYYTPSMVTTKDGKMTIKTTNQEPVSWQGWDEQNKVWTTFTRWYKSGMVQSWNKFCFTGGIIEIDLKLPGPGNMSGMLACVCGVWGGDVWGCEWGRCGGGTVGREKYANC